MPARFWKQKWNTSSFAASRKSKAHKSAKVAVAVTRNVELPDAGMRPNLNLGNYLQSRRMQSIRPLTSHSETSEICEANPSEALAS